MAVGLAERLYGHLELSWRWHPRRGPEFECAPGCVAPEPTAGAGIDGSGSSAGLLVCQGEGSTVCRPGATYRCEADSADAATVASGQRPGRGGHAAVAVPRRSSPPCSRLAAARRARRCVGLHPVPSGRDHGARDERPAVLSDGAVGAGGHACRRRVRDCAAEMLAGHRGATAATACGVSVADQDVRDIRPGGTNLAQRRVQGRAARIHAGVHQDDTSRMGHQVRTL